MMTGSAEGYAQIVQVLQQVGISAAHTMLVGLATGGLMWGLRGVVDKSSETSVGLHLDAKFDSVEHFWVVGVDRKRVGHDAKVRVRGLLLPYGPLVPSHPMQRPGYTLEGWDIIGDLAVRDTEAYDARDGIIYGDRVVRISRPAHGVYYAGLYGQFYGISNIAIPLTIDARILAKRDLLHLWHQKNATGVVVDVLGIAKSMRSFYKAYYSRLADEGKHIPKAFLEYENYALEVRALKVLPEQHQHGVTHIAASVCWEHPRSRVRERARTEYFNCRSTAQWNKCESVLHPIRAEEGRSLLLDYDDLAYLRHPRVRDLPQYNELLHKWLD